MDGSSGIKGISSGLLLRPALELLLHIASELSNGIRAALPAVPHLLDDLPQLILDLSLLLRRWGLDMSELVLGDEGHDIMDEYSHGLDFVGDIDDMKIIYPWNDNRIDLDDLLQPNCFFNPLKLLIA